MPPVRYCTVFSFIVLLYCESYIYISPICNVEINYSVEIRKLGILYFSLFTWYQSQERKPNFLGDRVSFRSPSPSPDLLLTTAAAADRRRHCRRRLFGKLFSGRKPQISRRTTPIYPPATRFSRAVTRRLSPTDCRPRAGAWVLVWARAFFSGDGTSHTGSSSAVLVFYPSGGPTRALLIHLLAIFASAVSNNSSSLPLQSPCDLLIRAPPCREQYFLQCLCIRAPPCREQYFFFAVSNIFAASSLP